MRLLFSIAVLGTCYLSCSINPVHVDNGGTTEITNAKIEGRLFNTGPGNDIVPARYADVSLFSMTADGKTTITDADGFFCFDTVDTGRHWLKGTMGNKKGVVRIVDIFKDDTLTKVSLLLRRMGGIIGNLVFDTSVYDPDSVYATTTIMIPEIRTGLRLDPTGAYQNLSIPPFHGYTIVIDNPFFPGISGTCAAHVQEGAVTTIDNTNSPPSFTHDASAMTSTARFYEEYRDTVHAADPDGDELEYILIRGPASMALTDNIITWVPEPQSCCPSRKIRISVQVHDHKGGVDELRWDIMVLTRDR